MMLKYNKLWVLAAFDLVNTKLLNIKAVLQSAQPLQ